MNKVTRRFWELGFKTAHIDPGLWSYSQCEEHPGVTCLTPQENVATSRSVELLDAINRMTPLSYYLSVNASAGNINTVDDVRDIVAEVPFAPPYFLYAHTLPPHAPYTTFPDCSPRPTVQFYLSGGRDPRKYLEALQCVNLRLLRFADFIARTDPEAIVIFHGDHGSKFQLDESLRLDLWSKRQFDERFSVLLAIKAPDVCLEGTPADFSLVNLYRLIFACFERRPPNYLDDDYYGIHYKVTTTGKVNSGRIYHYPDQGPEN